MLNVNGEQIDRIIFKKVKNGETIYESDMYGLRLVKGGADAAYWARPCRVIVSSNIYSPALTLSLNFYNPAPGAPSDRETQSELTMDGKKEFTAYAGDTFGWKLSSSDPSYRINSVSGDPYIKPGADGVLTDSYTRAISLSVTRLASGPELSCWAGAIPVAVGSTDRNLLIQVENPNASAYKFYGKAIVRWQVKSSYAGSGSRLNKLTVHSFGGDTISRTSTLSEASPTSASIGGMASGSAGLLPGGGIVSPGGGGVVVPPGGIVGPGTGGGIVGPGGGGGLIRTPYELKAPSNTLEPHSWIVQGAFWSYNTESGGTTPPKGVLPISVITQNSSGNLSLSYEFAGDDNDALVNEFNSLAPDGEELTA